MPDTKDYIAEALSANGIAAGEDAIRLLAAYLTELLRVNETMNLTAVRDPAEAAVKNIADCALCASLLPQGASLLDVGSGAGLPAFPFAVLRPDLRVTALDSTGKKVRFISETAALLGIGNLTARCGRAEELGASPEGRGRFDVVTARAVARMNILSELCLPLVRTGGLFLAMKSRLTDEELTEAAHAVTGLGGRVRTVKTFRLIGAEETADRTAILIDKVAPTPRAYPRPYARIAAKPL